MLNIFSQKFYVDGREYMYHCSVDDNDNVNFSYGTSNGLSSSFDTNLVNNVFGEIIIDFPTLRSLVNNVDKEFYGDDYCYKIKKLDDSKLNIIKSTLDNIKINDIIISENFLMESFKILENMWTDD